MRSCERPEITRGRERQTPAPGTAFLRVDEDSARRRVLDLGAARNAADVDPIVGFVRANDEARTSREAPQRIAIAVVAVAVVPIVRVAPIVVTRVVRVAAFRLHLFTDEIARARADRRTRERSTPPPG